MQRLVLLPSAFAISILLMAGLYDLMWAERPDYFRIQPEVNFLPIDLYNTARAYSPYKDHDTIPNVLHSTTQEDAAKVIVDLYTQLQKISADISEKTKEYETLAQQDANDYKSFEASQWSQIENFVASKAVAFDSETNSITKEMDNILKTAGVNSPDALATGRQSVDYANLAVRLADVKLRMTRADVDAREYAFHHFDEFQQQPSQKEYIEKNKALEALGHDLSNKRENADAIFSKLYGAFIDYRVATSDKLGYWDFVYFSVGAATTATFGDIAPNSTVVRMLVCLQVIGSILFTGFMVNWLSKLGTEP
jgi:hypothetical protein